MYLFYSYLKLRKKEFALLFLFFLIFSVTFYMYHLPLDAVMYPSLLCLILGIVFIIIDFYKVRKRHLILENIKTMSAAVISSLPDIKDIDDKDYQEIIKKLKDENQKLIEDANNRYNDMIDYYTVWVHQIKTPIASIKLTLQNEDSPLSRKLSSDLFRIEQYVEMVLAFLRLGSSSTDYIIKEYRLDTIIRQSVKKFAGEFINRKIRLEYEPVNQTVITDEKWLSFVIEQVISNSLKYTHQGYVKIYITDPKTLCIEDSGMGIAPEDLPRIFEKGYTGYNGRRDKKASGIGLYLCKTICKNLGHTITATSLVDKGTVIHINLEQYKLKHE